MYLNLEKNFRPREVKETFEKYLRETDLANDFEFYKKTQQIEKDIKFFNEMISRMGTTSNFHYEVRLSEGGLIYNDFLQQINGRFNYYDFSLLLEYVYMHETLKRLFKEYWIEGIGINRETVEKIKEFHVVVEYYMDIENVENYCYAFIGSSYGISEFKKVLNSIQEVQVSDTTEDDSNSKAK